MGVLPTEQEALEHTQKRLLAHGSGNTRGDGEGDEDEGEDDEVDDDEGDAEGKTDNKDNTVVPH